MLSQLTSDLLSPEEKEIFVQKMKRQSFTLITNQSVRPCPSIVYDVNTLDKYLDCNQITEQFMEARWYIIEKLLSDYKKPTFNARIVYKGSPEEVRGLNPNEILDLYPSKIILICPEKVSPDDRPYDGPTYQFQYLNFEKLKTRLNDAEMTINIQAEQDGNVSRDNTMTTFAISRQKDKRKTISK